MQIPTLNLAKKLDNNIEKLTKLRNAIPSDFDWKLYISILKNPEVNTNLKAYTHFNSLGKHNPDIYKSYYRVYYKIPPNFIEESYKTYLTDVYNLNIKFQEYKDLYIFYKKIGVHTYPLNDAYFRINFHIPIEFDVSIYTKRYSEVYELAEATNNEIYIFYIKNINLYPLDDLYYRIKYNIPEEFDQMCYSKRYNLGFSNDLESYKYYDSLGKSENQLLDDLYYRIKYNIPEEFDQICYSKRYGLVFSNDLESYKYYDSLGKSENQLLDDLYYRIKYNIPEEFDQICYSKRYDLVFSSDLESYKYYESLGKTQNQLLDDVYYRIRYNIPEEFEMGCYARRYNLGFSSDLESYKYYDSLGKNQNQLLDDVYYRMRYNIPEEFDQMCYSKRYGLIISNDLESYKYYDSLGKNQNQSLDDVYYRMRYYIPEEFEMGCYARRYNLGFSSDLESYKYYDSLGKNQNQLLDDVYYRIRYNIPEEFDQICVSNRYNVGFSSHLESYKYYDIKHKNNIFILDNSYYRIRYGIPEEFDQISYSKRYNIAFSNNLESYKYYDSVGKHQSQILDDVYYRIRYNIPEDFDKLCYSKRYNISFSTDLESYKYYDTEGKTNNYILDDKYFKLLYNVEAEFDWNVYLHCYQSDFAENCKNISNAFKHYSLKKYEEISSFNVKYYKKIYNVKDSFDHVKYYNYNKIFLFTNDIQHILKIYKQEIKLDDIYNEVNAYSKKDAAHIKFINNYLFLKNKFPQITSEDDKRYFIYLQDFIQDYYLCSEKEYGKYKNIKTRKTVEEIVYEPVEKTITKERKIMVPRHDSVRNDNYSSKLENYQAINNMAINNTSSTQPSTSNDLSLDKLRLLANKYDIDLNNINGLNKALEDNKTPHSEPNNKLMSLDKIQSLANKYNIDLNNILNSNNAITNSSNSSKNETNPDINMSLELQIHDTNSVKPNNFNSENGLNSKNTTNTILKNKTSMSSSLKVLDMLRGMKNEISIIKPNEIANIAPEFQPHEYEYEEKIEYYNETIIENTPKTIFKEIEVETTCEVYNSCNYSFTMSDYSQIYDDLHRIHHNLYFIYRFNSYIDFNFKNKKINILNNSEKHAIYYTFNHYKHIQTTLRNNIIKLGDGWRHSVICGLDNEAFVRTICNNISPNICVIVLQFNNITYNEVNNVLLDKIFWQNIWGETILLHNENTFILEEKITNFLDNKCLGYKLPSIFTFNKYVNGYSEISIRKKNIILEFLDNIEKINIQNELCNEIKGFFKLDYYSEDMLYSTYVFQNISNTLEYSKMNKIISDFDDTILAIFYKFSNVKSELREDIHEFVKNKNFSKIIFLEKFFSSSIV